MQENRINKTEISQPSLPTVKEKHSTSLPKPTTMNNDPDPYQNMELELLKENLRQARQTFNASFIGKVASIGISVFGAVLLFSGKASEGSVTVATGLISTTFCSQMANESNQKLEQLRKNLKEMRPDPED
jgi:L-lactate utilization protein LutC